MATNWEVTTQRQGEELNGAGVFVPVMEIHFATIPEGIPGNIKVPLNIYTAEYVAQQIDSLVARIKAVQTL